MEMITKRIYVIDKRLYNNTKRNNYQVIKDLQENNCDFWSNVYNKSFTYRDPTHSFIDLKKYCTLSTANYVQMSCC